MIMGVFGVEVDGEEETRKRGREIEKEQEKGRERTT